MINDVSFVVKDGEILINRYLDLSLNTNDSDFSIIKSEESYFNEILEKINFFKFFSNEENEEEKLLKEKEKKLQKKEAERLLKEEKLQKKEEEQQAQKTNILFGFSLSEIYNLENNFFKGEEDTTLKKKEKKYKHLSISLYSKNISCPRKGDLWIRPSYESKHKLKEEINTQLYKRQISIHNGLWWVAQNKKLNELIKEKNV